MAPASDLGPVDPQLLIGLQLVAAKDIIATVEDAVQKVEESPDTYPIYVSLLDDVTAIMVQQARSALGSTENLLREALRSNPDRDDCRVEELLENLRSPLIDVPQSHTALFGADDAKNAGLPVIMADTGSTQWRMLWRLWAKYFELGLSKSIYESASASQIFDRFNSADN